MLLVLDPCDVALVPPVHTGGQVSALGQSEESGAPAWRRRVEGPQAAMRNETFVLFVVLIKEEAGSLMRESVQRAPQCEAQRRRPRGHTKSANSVMPRR